MRVALSRVGVALIVSEDDWQPVDASQIGDQLVKCLRAQVVEQVFLPGLQTIGVQRLHWVAQQARAIAPVRQRARDRLFPVWAHESSQIPNTPVEVCWLLRRRMHSCGGERLWQQWSAR